MKNMSNFSVIAVPADGYTLPIPNPDVYGTCIEIEWHYSDVILSAMASQITSPTIVYSTVYSGEDQDNIKASWGEFTGDRWIPHTNGQ